MNVNGTADAVLTGKVSVTGQKVSLTLDTGLIELAEKTIELVIPAKIKPVSYTHLDVYKRQREKQRWHDVRPQLPGTGGTCLLYTSRCV